MFLFSLQSSSLQNGDSAIKIKYQKQNETETPEEKSRNEGEDKDQTIPTFGNVNDAVRLYLREMGRVNPVNAGGESRTGPKRSSPVNCKCAKKRSTLHWLSRNDSSLPNTLAKSSLL